MGQWKGQRSAVTTLPGVWIRDARAEAGLDQSGGSRDRWMHQSPGITTHWKGGEWA